MKAIYRNKKSGGRKNCKLYIVDCKMKNEELKLRNTAWARPTLPAMEIAAKLEDFERVGRADYRELLIKNGFVIQSSQRYLF
jgi:hypothetical protein